MQTHALLRWTPQVLFLAGILALGYASALWTRGAVFQAYESWRFDRGAALAAASDPGQPPSPHAVIGRLEVPRLDLSVMIVEGVDDRALGLGAGHVPGTALPGQNGNVALAGHRDTFFRPLRSIRKGDRIVLRTPLGASEYAVIATRIAKPNETELLHSGSEELLTLITCYPFSYVGPAPERFVVQARKLDRPAS